MISVVNIHKDKNYDIYIGRLGKGRYNKYGNPYTNMISYGIMSNIISAIMENDNEEIEEEDDDEDGEESSITVSSEWGIL